MSHSIIPETWNTVSKEGELALNKFAERYIEMSKTIEPKNLVIQYSKEVVEWIESDEGRDADASVKETVINIIDFLVELTSDSLTEDEIIELWQEEFYKNA